MWEKMVSTILFVKEQNKLKPKQDERNSAGHL